MNWMKRVFGGKWQNDMLADCARQLQEVKPRKALIKIVDVPIQNSEMYYRV